MNWITLLDKHSFGIFVTIMIGALCIWWGMRRDK